MKNKQTKNPFFSNTHDLFNFKIKYLEFNLKLINLESENYKYSLVQKRPKII